MASKTAAPRAPSPRGAEGSGRFNLGKIWAPANVGRPTAAAGWQRKYRPARALRDHDRPAARYQHPQERDRACAAAQRDGTRAEGATALDPETVFFDPPGAAKASWRTRAPKDSGGAGQGCAALLAGEVERSRQHLRCARSHHHRHVPAGEGPRRAGVRSGARKRRFGPKFGQLWRATGSPQRFNFETRHQELATSTTGSTEAKETRRWRAGNSAGQPRGAKRQKSAVPAAARRSLTLGGAGRQLASRRSEAGVGAGAAGGVKTPGRPE